MRDTIFRLGVGSLAAVGIIALFVVAGQPESTNARLIQSNERTGQWTALIRLDDVDERSLSLKTTIQLVDPPIQNDGKAHLIVSSNPSLIALDPETFYGTPRGRITQPLEVFFSLAGNPSRFPFDSYSSSIFVVMDSGFTLPLLPAMVELDAQLSEFSVQYESNDVGGLDLRFQRSRFDIVLFAFFVVLMFLLTALVMAISFLAKNDTWRFELIGIIATAIAAFQLRSLIVPSDLPGRNWVDLVSIIPFAVTLPMFLLGFWKERSVRRAQAKDEIS